MLVHGGRKALAKVLRSHIRIFCNDGHLGRQQRNLWRLNSSSSDPKHQKVVVSFSDGYKNAPDPKRNPQQFSRVIAPSFQSLTSSETLKKLLTKADPYVKLMRIDRPIGTWLLFWPCGWSILLAADPQIVPLAFVVKNLGLFLTGAFIMRGAGCTINDMWDRDIDSKVDRTKSRPLVSGEIGMSNATVFLGAQLSAGLAILLQLNWYSIFLGASSMALVVLYPLAKRVTDYPQLVLGLTFNWGALLGWSALRGSVDPTVCLPLYLTGICWTLLYDTIYAHQDKKDDMIIGIKSTALKFNERTPQWLWANAIGMMTGLTTVGVMTDMHWPYYLTLGLVGTHISRQIMTLKKDTPEDCSTKFMSNSRVGLLIFLAIALGKWDSIGEYLKDSETQPSVKPHEKENSNVI